MASTIVSADSPSELNNISTSETQGNSSGTSDCDDRSVYSSACSSPDYQSNAAAQLHDAKVEAQKKVFDDYLSQGDKGVDSEPAKLCPDDGNSDVAVSLPKKNIEEVRKYQQELFERALEGNIIAVLDTGSGKTLIACLLIRHILMQESLNRVNGSSPKIVCFLANSVHLVQQQARVLHNNLAIKPVVFVGDSKAEVWKSRQIWPQVMLDSVPVVCTPAVLLQCFDAALIRMDQISLLVFDEAHHAKKDHPYSKIIRSYYLSCELGLRPRIFGMTASPVDSKGDIDESIRSLEELLHSKIVTTDDPSKLSFVPKPRNIVWKYPKPIPQPETPLFTILSEKLKFSDDAKKGFIYAQAAVTELGPWCADRTWKYIIGTSEHESARLIKRVETNSTFVSIDSVDLRTAIIADLYEAVSIANQIEYQKPIPDPSQLSPKVLKVYQELSKIYTSQPHTRTIVFVDQRLTANILKDCFERLNIPNLRPGVLLGSAQSSTSLRQQEQFLNNFRVGLINLIFATSVADEGIDIPQCNLCVRFDLYKSPIQYIQSRGRARMKDSLYAHVIEEDNIRHENELSHAINCDRYITEYCRRLDPSRLLGQGTKLERFIAQDSARKTFKTTSGVVCDYDNSLVVLSRFASSLQYLGTVEKEVYEEEINEADRVFRYSVRLPKLKELDLKGALGEWKPNKQLARRSAAWNCCFLLRRKGLLDDELNSPFRKVKPGNLNARLAVSEKKSAYAMLTKPSIWQTGLHTVPTDLFAYLVQIKPRQMLQRIYSSLVLLTRVSLPTIPSFVVYLEEGIAADVVVSNVISSVVVTSEEVEALTFFTTNGVFLDVYNKFYEANCTHLSYWLAPPAISPKQTPSSLSDIVDMDAVEVIKQGRIRWSSEQDATEVWAHKFICDPKNGNFHYLTGEAAPNVTIYDKVPDTIPHIAQKSRKNIIDFSDSHWKASKANFIESSWDSNQPVFSAHLLTARRNFLESKIDKTGFNAACLIAPQPLEVSQLSPAFAVSCFLWPSIVHRLEAYLIALEGVSELGLQGISAELALEAFTKNYDNEDHKQQTHHGESSGMGRNYERLEFIGDSLLKMTTTISVFLRTNFDEEGMHCRRMEILCNRRLFEVSTSQHHLYRYVRTEGFNRTTWYPENLVLLKGRGAKSVAEPVKHAELSHDLGMKTIADVSEAIIGAAVISSRGHANRFDLGIQAVTKLVSSEDHSISSWAEFAAMYTSPRWSLSMDDVQANKLTQDIGAKTGYMFKRPRLLRSAFTHSSDTNALVPDLQRLEFLGDAVLDWVSISWLFDSNPTRNPQWLTEHKMAMVSNKFLATLAVVLDFDKFIFCTSTQLFVDIVDYAKRVRKAYNRANVNRDFWTQIDSPPKALSDLVESYIGAVLVDSDFDYEEIEKFFRKHILWFFEEISLYDSFANRQPTTYLHKKLCEEYKCQDFNIIHADVVDKVGKTEATAGVIIHNKVVAKSSGTNAKSAKVRASQMALEKLSDMTIQDFRREYECFCKFKD